jgi:hypothetical protein
MFKAYFSGPGEVVVEDYRGGTDGWSVEWIVGEILGVVPALAYSAPGVVISEDRRAARKDASVNPVGTTEGRWSIYYKTDTPDPGAPIVKVGDHMFILWYGNTVELS